MGEGETLQRGADDPAAAGGRESGRVQAVRGGADGAVPAEEQAVDEVGFWAFFAFLWVLRGFEIRFKP